MAEGDAKTSILVVDDEEGVRHYLQLLLTREGFAVSTVENAEHALKRLHTESFALVLCDIRMPGEMDGLGLLVALQTLPIACDVIMMSAYGSRETALEAVRQGAYDYIDKPIQQDDLLLVLQKWHERKRLRHENRALRAVLREASEDHGMIGRSALFRKTLERAKRVARFPTNVLIQGETGTGKGLLANAIHQWSERRNQRIVEVNCGAIPANLLESELFGYARGAFTGAHRDYPGLLQSADGSTLFLDELGELPPELQVKLLRVLEEGSVRRLGETRARAVNIRLIAATNRNLEADVKAGRFREDLYHRLHVFSIRIPSLRERTEDIPLLVDAYIQRFNASYKTMIKGVVPEAMKVLMAYPWEGNIRQLRNSIESAMVQETQSLLTVEALPEQITTPHSSPAFVSMSTDEIWIPPAITSIKKASRAVELQLISRALQQTGGNRTAAAKLLEISHRALLYKIKEYEIH